MRVWFVVIDGRVGLVLMGGFFVIVLLIILDDEVY
jgi:hypothetical protein